MSLCRPPPSYPCAAFRDVVTWMRHLHGDSRQAVFFLVLSLWAARRLQSHCNKSIDRRQSIILRPSASRICHMRCHFCQCDFRNTFLLCVCLTGPILGHYSHRPYVSWLLSARRASPRSWVTPPLTAVSEVGRSHVSVPLLLPATPVFIVKASQHQPHPHLAGVENSVL